MPSDLEGCIGDAQRRLPKAQVAGGHKTKPLVIPGITFEKDGRFWPFGHGHQRFGNQCGSDTLALEIGPYPDGTEHEHMLESLGSIENRLGVEHLADDLIVDGCDETQIGVPRPGRPERIEQCPNGWFAEGLHRDPAHFVELIGSHHADRQVLHRQMMSHNSSATCGVDDDYSLVMNGQPRRSIAVAAPTDRQRRLRRPGGWVRRTSDP